ncbi:hypothetical protein EKO27_g10851 [Xylaria grammica]|uniref:G domain-containing protein n=1 Tax=Xylaria grammica TaxID=363999 RepID=A0A439CQ11_9PEZI|nr:hypothetical protein EKO27_g10851 [Xylaria grammica]
METSVNPPERSEPSIKPEATDHSGIVKPEPSDVPLMSHLPSRDVVQPTPELQQPGLGEELGDAEHNETNYLERLCNNKALGTLETSVSVATGLLDQLRDALSDYEGEEVHRWMNAIVALRERTAPTRTVVGVVGNTGAGKSSVINALLDEERLLPTNCLRACTASPTEISFNYSDDPRELYRAEIEFISIEEWIRELQVLFSDLLDGNGQVSREATKTDSEAGIAYAKVKAVYPKKTKEMLAQANARDLANEPAVRAILGTTKVLKKETAKEIYQQMQRYVDSKEKSTGPVGRKERADASMEYWPLIKVVRIFTKANALSTGAVIVDLPGVQDSNAARAAVAANYMKSCTGLWIVAPITRAVDDKTAKTLLGDSFKRQLKYDGTYSAVSFICSKTDDISITEAADSLGLEAELSESWDVAEKLRVTQRSLESQISNLKEAKNVLGQELDECEAKTDLWEDLQFEIVNGKTVYAPSNPKKRRRSVRPLGSRKTMKSDVDDDWDASDSGPSDKENSQSEQSHEPLTEEKIEEQLSLLRAQRKKIRGERRPIDSEIAGLDQENAAEEDDETFDPDQDTRDYDKVAQSLPVFCVSSRAYQKLSGKLEKDDFQSHGFSSIEDTEIPKLQEHAKQLTEARRTSHCRHFLNDLSRLVNSMKLWSADDSTGPNLTDGEKSSEGNHLKKLLSHLEEELESLLKLSITSIRASIEDHVFKSIKESMPSAIEAAPDTAYSWGAPRAMGGLYWATYKATVRRQGVYSGASGPRDFNQELFEPISRRLATSWERAFQRRVPAILNDFAKRVTEKLEQFHQTTKARAEQRRINITGLITLSSQIQAHTRTVESLPGEVYTIITEAQREANRQFTPAICDAMTDAYTICTNEYGTGSYARMKSAMTDHVDDVRHSMFTEATAVVKQHLEEMCRSVMKNIAESIQVIFDTVSAEYTRALVGRTVDQSQKPTREELDMRSLIHKILIQGDKLFAPVLGDSTPEASHGRIADEGDSNNSQGTAAEDHKDLDELMQADIREQGLNDGADGLGI